MSQDDIEPTMEYIGKAIDRGRTDYLLRLAQSGKVLFYPDCAVDWQPMARMTDVVRAFVFCKRRRDREPPDLLSVENCPKSIRSLFTRTGCGDIDIETVRRAGIIGSLQGGAYTLLTRTIEVDGEKIERMMFVASLEADPVEAYRDLFVRHGVGPKFLCLHGCGWDGEMKDVVLNAGPAMPTYLIAKNKPYASPWLLRWQNYPYWGTTTIYQRRDQQPHPVNEMGPITNFGIANGRLRPQDGLPDYCVHLTVEEYLDNPWEGPQRKIFVDTADQQLIAAIRAQDNRVEPLRLHGLPLRDALPALAKACIKRGIETVYLSRRLGLEDEAGCVKVFWPKRFQGIVVNICTGARINADAVAGFVCDDLPPIHGEEGGQEGR
jgi:hypothetical protein